ncbi:hypothetical protein AMECASPLE_032141 [Ameca splendens]|uniref:Secreted protein n=1 Tax=Ameca splendens TaxID=208324 RepID=A0ABV1AE25_9TELE
MLLLPSLDLSSDCARVSLLLCLAQWIPLKLLLANSAVSLPSSPGTSLLKPETITKQTPTHYPPVCPPSNTDCSFKCCHLRRSHRERFSADNLRSPSLSRPSLCG